MAGEAAGQVLDARQQREADRKRRARLAKWADMLNGTRRSVVEAVEIDDGTAVEVVAVEASSLGLPAAILAQIQADIAS